MRFKRSSACFFGFVLSFLHAQPATAVSVSPQGTGEALIFPYFTVTGGNNTLVSLLNERAVPQALKVIFRDSFGEVAFSTNLYIDSYGSFVFAISEQDGQLSLTVPDHSCLVPGPDRWDLSALQTTHSGFVEVISMAAFDLSGGRTLLAAVERQDCAVLEAAWDPGGFWRNNERVELEAPVEGLRGSSSIINVARGTQYTIPVVALNSFSNIVQHSAPETSFPNLTSAHDSGTPIGETASRNCVSKPGPCQEDNWASPMDAVAAALIAEAGTGEFTIEESVGAAAEVVFTFPMRYHYLEKARERQDAPNAPRLQSGDALAFAEYGASIFDREGKSLHPPPSCQPVAGPTPGFVPRCGTAYELSDRDSLSVIDVFSLNATEDVYGTTIMTPILGTESEVFFPSPSYPSLPSSGSILFTLLNPVLGKDSLLTSNAGNQYRGVPFIAVMLQEVTNRRLVDDTVSQPVRANYGTGFGLSYTQPDFLREQP